MKFEDLSVGDILIYNTDNYIIKELNHHIKRITELTHINKESGMITAITGEYALSIFDKHIKPKVLDWRERMENVKV